MREGKEMTPDEAKAAIFQYLCKKYQSSGVFDFVSGEEIRRECAIPEGVFFQTVNTSRKASGDLELEFDVKRPDWLKLGVSWRGKCQDMEKR